MIRTSNNTIAIPINKEIWRPGSATFGPVTLPPCLSTSYREPQLFYFFFRHISPTLMLCWNKANSSQLLPKKSLSYCFWRSIKTFCIRKDFFLFFFIIIILILVSFLLNLICFDILLNFGPILLYFWEGAWLLCR